MTNIDRGQKKSGKRKRVNLKSDKIWEVERNIFKAGAGAYPLHITGGMSKTVIVQ